MRILRLVAIGALICAVAYALGTIDWHALLETLRHALIELVVLAAALNFLQILAKAERWRLMLK